MLAKGIVLVPQAHSLFGEMTVRENVEMGAYTVRDSAVVRRRYGEVEELFPLVRERAHDKAGSLSGGQQRLVELARSLMLDPALIVLDEPSIGLDPPTRKIVFQMIRLMNQQGRTILLVEQNARAGLRLSTHGLVLENGKVRLTGTGREILEHPEIGALYLGGAVSEQRAGVMTAADPRVQAAVDHWAPRFIAMGVDYNDFVRTTGRIERWEDWLDAWIAVADEHLELAERRRERRAEAERRGGLPARSDLPALRQVRVGARRRRAPRRDRAGDRGDGQGPLVSGPDRRADRGAARRGHARGQPPPARGAERPPLVVLIPGLDSTKEEFFHWENAFLARGMATLSMDGPGQGEAGFTLPIRHDYEVAVAAMLDRRSGRPRGGRRPRPRARRRRRGQPRRATTRRAPPRSSRASAPSPAISGPYNFGEVWDQLPPLTREAFTVKSGARDERRRPRARERSRPGRRARPARRSRRCSSPADSTASSPGGRPSAPRARRRTGRSCCTSDGTHVCSNIPYRYRPLVADWMAEQLASVR